MKQVGIVFKFEFLNYTKRKSFIGITFALILIVAGVLSWGRISELFEKEIDSPDPGTVETLKIAFIDKTDGQAGEITYYNGAYQSQNTEFVAVDMTKSEAEQAVIAGEFDSALIMTSPLSYIRIVKNLGLYDEFSTIFDSLMLRNYHVGALQAQGLNQEDTESILGARISGDVQLTASGKSQEQNFFYTYVLIFLLYFSIMIYGQFVSSSVATEKSTRAMELLITSSKPTNFMFGKVLGAGFAGFLQMALILGSAFVFYNLNKSYFVDSFIIQSIFSMPLSILIYTLVFFVLGFFLYAFIYASLASLVNRMEELSTAIMPATMLFVFAFALTMFAMGTGNLDSLLMRVCSFVPFTSSMAMFARIAMGEVLPIEIAASIFILLLTTVFVGFLAAKIYRLGVLMYGTPPKIKNVIKMLRKS